MLERAEMSLWRQLKSHVPKPIKTWLLARYWPLKELLEQLNEYMIELVGYIPSHTLRLIWYRQVGGMSIGSHSSIHRGCRVYRPVQVQIGYRSVINYGVLLDGRSGLVIGNNVSISEGVVVLTLEHDIDSPDFALQGGKVEIRDYAFIGSYARILPGVKIGEGAVVGVGSVVTNDVPPYTVVGGSPARSIRERSRGLTYQLDYRKSFG